MRLDRRQAFRQILTEMRVSGERQQGRAVMRLADLGTVPDHQLMLIRPIVVANCTLTREAGIVSADFADTGRRLRLFPEDPASAAALEGFDGATDIGGIACRVADAIGWPPTQAFAYVRGLFLHLVTLGISVPG